LKGLSSVWVVTFRQRGRQIIDTRSWLRFAPDHQTSPHFSFVASAVETSAARCDSRCSAKAISLPSFSSSWSRTLEGGFAHGDQASELVERREGVIQVSGAVCVR